MSIIKSNMTAPPPSGGSLSSIGDMNSLRFDGNSYLSKSISADQSAWSLSVWAKRSKISKTGYEPIIADNVSNDDGLVAFENTDKIMFLDKKYSGGTGKTNYKRTNSIYRDTSAWYHIFIAYDATSSNVAGAFNMEINGIAPDATSGADQYPRNSLGWWNGAMFIGRVNTYYFNGYLANIHFIDGQALDANAFGQEISGVWVPKAYDPATSGAYGTNGFHLDFAASNMDWTNSKVLDASGNGNDWNLN